MVEDIPPDVKICQNYLVIQATSCASERTFSSGGATLTTQKTKLDPTNVYYLVYCKENLPKIKLVRPRLDDEEEREMEEQFQNDDDEE